MRRTVVIAVVAGLVVVGCSADDPIVRDVAEAGPAEAGTGDAESPAGSTPTTTTVVPTSTVFEEPDDSWFDDFLDEVRASADSALASSDPEMIRSELEKFFGYHGLDEGRSSAVGREEWRAYELIAEELEVALEALRFESVDPDLTGQVLTSADFSTLPAEVLVTQVGDAVVLVEGDGTVVGHLRDEDVNDPALHERLGLERRQPGYPPVERPDLPAYEVVSGQLLVGGGVVFDLEDGENGELLESSYDGRFLTRYRWGASTDTLVFDRETSDLIELPDGCVVSLEVDDDWYLSCWVDGTVDGTRGEARLRGPDGSTMLVSGPAYGPFEFGGGELAVPGHWAWLTPGPDGAVLGQWSGECEVPSAHVLVGGEPYGIAQIGDELRLASRSDFEDPAVYGLESWAIGWLDGGEAVIGVNSGPCSTEADGLYAVGLDLELRLIYEPSGNALLLHASG